MAQAPSPAEYKETLLGELDQAYRELTSALEGLSDDRMTQVWLGSWSIREILIHMIGWQREMTGSLERIGDGERPTPEGVDYGDADAWNARFVQAVGRREASQIVRDLADAYWNYREAAKSLSEDRFTPGRTVDRILHSSGIDHLREHAAEIAQWRRREPA